jgi:pimeloyl-ACP methyl ester carboxylesterase
MPAVGVDAGTIHYQSAGPVDGRPIVLLHGYAMAASLWTPLTERLAARGLRCIAPTLPLGGHSEPLREGYTLTMKTMAAIVADVITGLELDDVVLVGNDTGGAIAQLVATLHPERLGALVLTSCDAFEHWPPPALKPLIAAAKLPGGFRAALQTMHSKLARRRAFGELAHADIDDLVQEWLSPLFRDGRVVNDLCGFTASIDARTMLDAAERLPEFQKPALVAWSADDTFFPVDDGRRLADVLPAARFELIEGARTFSMIDNPDRLAHMIKEFASAPRLAIAS